MMRLILFAIIICSRQHLALGQNRLGIACTADIECGTYEFCQNLAFIAGGGCTSGYCECLPGYSPGLSGTCEHIVSLSLGAQCAGTSNEILPRHAICDMPTRTVICSTTFIASGDQCVVDAARGVRWFGEDCSQGICGGAPDGSAFLFCDRNTTQCACMDYLRYYNPDKQDCLLRDYGDPCNDDSDCASNLYAGSGFVCDAGRCGCGPQHIPIEIKSLNSTTIYSRTICQLKGTKQNLPSGSVCISQYPELFSSTSDLQFCKPDFVCVRCPADDNDENMKSYHGHCQATVVNSGAGTPTTTPKPFSKQGTVCEDDFQCGTNEHCLKHPNALAPVATQGILDPPCRRGVCSCLEKHAVDMFGICSTYVYLPIGSPCNNAANEILPANTYCTSFNTVNCTRGTTLYNGTCYRVVPLFSSPPPLVSFIVSTQRTTPQTFTGPFINWRYREFGENCSVVARQPGDLGCRPGLACRSVPLKGLVCDCALPNQMFNVRNGYCQTREFGDPCLRNEDCAGAYSAIGSACVRGKCACDFQNYVAVQAGVYNSSAIIVRNICVPRTDTINVEKGKACKLDAVGGGAWCDGTKGLACFQCPEDISAIGEGYGRCRSGGPTYFLSGVKSKGYGRPCITGGDCYNFDTNTTCVFMSESFSPGCSMSGTCRCSTGSVLDPVDGYCYRLINLAINATCIGNTVWEVFPNSSLCDPVSRRVTCVRGYRWEWANMACVPIGSVATPPPSLVVPTVDSRTTIYVTLSYGELCHPNVTRTANIFGRPVPVVGSCDESKRLTCFKDGRCNCTIGYRWLADTTRTNFTCVPRGYGDRCAMDADCYTGGRYTEPHYEGGARCIHGFCMCEPKNFTRTDVLRVEGQSQLDGSTLYVAVPICLRRSIYHQHTNLAPGQNCTLSPWTLSSYGGYVRSCAASSICMQCPGAHYPTCQQPMSLVSEYTTERPLPVNPTAYPLQHIQRTIGPVYDNTINLHWHSFETTRYCRSDRECPQRGESCDNNRGFSPACSTGRCFCPGSQVPSASGACEELTVKRLGEPCRWSTRGPDTELYPLGAFCRNGRVECANSGSELQQAINARMVSKHISLTRLDNSCFLIKGLAEPCSTPSDLCNPMEGLECSSTTRTCACSTGTFDTTTRRCRFKFEGETCRSDADCYPGSSISVRCVRGICNCLNDADPVEVRAYLGPLYPMTMSMRMCVPRNRYTLANIGEPCSTARRISRSMQMGSVWSASYWPRTQSERVCAPGLTCLSCSTQDPDNGICSRFNGRHIFPTDLEIPQVGPPPGPFFINGRATQPPNERPRVDVIFSPQRPPPQPWQPAGK